MSNLSEEEKKAIEGIRKDIEEARTIERVIGKESVKNIRQYEIALNLIDRLQKENDNNYLNFIKEKNRADKLLVHYNKEKENTDRLQKENEELQEKRDIEVNYYTDKMNFIGENVEKVYEIKDKKINEQDKVIDLMAELLCGLHLIDELGQDSWNWNKEQMKEYFYKQVEVEDE